MRERGISWRRTGRRGSPPLAPAQRERERERERGADRGDRCRRSRLPLPLPTSPKTSGAVASAVRRRRGGGSRSHRFPFDLSPPQASAGPRASAGPPLAVGRRRRGMRERGTLPLQYVCRWCFEVVSDPEVIRRRMQDPLPLPSCFFSGAKTSDEGGSSSPAVSSSRAGQSAVVSVYRTKIAGHCRLITVTWCKNLLVHGLSISVDGDGDDANQNPHCCRVELRPWHFWKKHGSRRFDVVFRSSSTHPAVFRSSSTHPAATAASMLEHPAFYA